MPDQNPRLEDLNREAQELTSEEAENTDGGIIAVLIGVRDTDPGFPGGVSLAAGDVNSDGQPDIITGAGPGAPGGHVK